MLESLSQRSQTERLTEDEAVQRQREDERLLFRRLEQLLELVDDHVGELSSGVVSQGERAGVVELHWIGHRQQRARARAHPYRLVSDRPVNQLREAAAIENVWRDARLGSARAQPTRRTDNGIFRDDMDASLD